MKIVIDWHKMYKEACKQITRYEKHIFAAEMLITLCDEKLCGDKYFNRALDKYIKKSRNLTGFKRKSLKRINK